MIETYLSIDNGELLHYFKQVAGILDSYDKLMGGFLDLFVYLNYEPALVLVCNKMTLFKGDIKAPSEWLEPIQKDGYSFAFRTKPGHVKPFEHLSRKFYPFYEVPAMEWYYMYSRIE